MAPYGLTSKQMDKLTDRLSNILDVERIKLEAAFQIITLEEVARIAKNEKEKSDV